MISRPAKRVTAKPKRTATSGSGGGAGAAVPARRAKPAATTLTPRVLRLTQSRFPASSRTKTNPTRMNPKSSPARFAPIRRQAVNGANRAGLLFGFILVGYVFVRDDAGNRD